MQLLHNLALGFGVALAPTNLLYAFVGCLLGMLGGVLPGISPVATIAMLLPLSYAMPPLSVLIMLASVYFGAQYGRSIATILLNVPDAATVRMRGDGYQIALQASAGSVLSAAALGSLFAGCVGTLFLATLAPALAELALQFGPVEYFSLMVLGLIAAVVLSSGSLLKAMAMIVLGLLLGLVGVDVSWGVTRFAFDLPELSNGIGLVGLSMGVFGYGEIIIYLARSVPAREALGAQVRGLWPSKQDLKEMMPAVVRGTVLGSLFGSLPGGGARLVSFSAYALDKNINGNLAVVPVGKGNIRGVAATASVNTAGVQTSFFPLLALGIPPNAVMALMIGAMTIHNIRPGPQVMSSSPELFWGLIASMWIANLMLAMLNLPLIAIWIKLLIVPYRWLFPVIVLFCASGVYATKHSTFDIWLAAVFGLVGYVFNKLDIKPEPLLLGFILGPMMEENLRSALQLSGGDWSVFIIRPVSAGLLAAALFMMFLVLLPISQARRAEVYVQD